MSEFETAYPSALFNLEQGIYGVSSQYITSIFKIEKLIKMPDMPHYMRGMVNLRGKIVPIIDTRKFYGFQSVAEEISGLVELIEKRKQDHINWIRELEDSVMENRKFKLTTDPHACAFGKWYDHYKTNDKALEHLLKKFDAPHKRIHAVGVEVIKLVEQGDWDAAFDVIKKAKNRELVQMINLFELLVDEFAESKRELAIILENPQTNKEIGLSVDSVIAVEPILNDRENTLASVAQKTHESLGLGKRLKDESSVFIIDENYFLNL